MDRSPRYDINERVALEGADNGESFPGVSQNISETGVLIQAWRAVPRGTKVALTFPRFSTTAEVIWTRESEKFALIGLRFLEMSRKDRKALTQLLATSEEALR